MREIKFRVWDEITKTMYYSVEITLDGYRWFKPESVDRVGYNPFGSKLGFLMQFIGLKDAQNKEIYEGDILTSDDLIDGKVEYLDGMYRCGCHGIYKSLIDQFKIKIIGNIYENKELLKGG